MKSHPSKGKENIKKDITLEEFKVIVPRLDKLGFERFRFSQRLKDKGWKERQDYYRYIINLNPGKLPAYEQETYDFIYDESKQTMRLSTSKMTSSWMNQEIFLDVENTLKELEDRLL